MDQQEVINKIDLILEVAKTAVLATSDSQGKAHLRWMTPVVLKYQPDAIYCFTVPGSEKIKHISANNNVEWMVQARDLREIVNIQGTANVINTPATKNELLEILAPRLATFWKANANPEEFVIFETKISLVTYFEPMKAKQELVTFGGALESES